MSSPDRIYLSPPHMSGSELDLVREAFETNWLSTVGPHINTFEAEMTKKIGHQAVALASGTAAIHLGLKLLGVTSGDEVLCPSLTFVASCNPILYCGAIPVFVDSERASWNIDPELLEEAILDRKRLTGRAPKALIVVHLYGQTADMAKINNVCETHGVAIFEDAAEALGANHLGTPAGALAPLAALSFNGNKIITTTGGGMLLCASQADADKARFWSTQARDPGIAYEHSECGYNYRMSNVLAGIGRGQLAVLDARVDACRQVFERYTEALTNVFTPTPQASWGTHTRWLSTFTLPSKAIRDRCIDALNKENIEARPVWKPMHLQPLFADARMIGGAVAEDLFHLGICLPSGSQLTAAQQLRIVGVLNEVVA